MSTRAFPLDNRATLQLLSDRLNSLDPTLYRGVGVWAYTGYSGAVGAIMKLTVFVAAASSAVALVGFAGAANASATIDLIWADTGTDTISNVSTSSSITLQVILTAGPKGSLGAAVSVDYSAALGKLTVIGFASTPGGELPLAFETPTNTGSRIENINSFSSPPLFGTGLLVDQGQSHQLGTVTFHKSALLIDTFEITVDVNGASDGVLDLAGNLITDPDIFNSAFLINIPEPGGLELLGSGIAVLAFLYRRRRHSVER